MKVTLTIATFAVIFCFNSAFSQSDCDPSECVRYAPEGTYKVIGYTDATEVIEDISNITYHFTCEMLCLIEASRKPDENIVILLDTYKILIYAGNIEPND